MYTVKSETSWRKAQPWVGYTPTDSDAIAFLTATSISTDRIEYAIDWLVIYLKSISCWTKMTGLWPMVGGTSGTNAVNLKTPGTFNLTFNGTVTHDANGCDPDGSTAYAQTGIIPATHLATSITIGCYCREATAVSTADYEMGTINAAQAAGVALATRRTSGSRVGILAGYDGGANAGMTGQTDGYGAGASLVTKTTGTNVRWYSSWGQSSYPAASATGTKPASEIYLFCLNNAGTAQSFSNKQQAGALVGEGLSTTEAPLVSKALAKFNYILGRHV